MIGGRQLHVRDQAIEQRGAALHHDERPLLHLQGIGGEADAEGFLEPPANDVPDHGLLIVDC